MSDVIQDVLTAEVGIDFSANITRGTNSITPTFNPITNDGTTYQNVFSGPDTIQNTLG